MALIQKLRLLLSAALMASPIVVSAQDKPAVEICSPLMTFGSRDYVSERVDLQIAWSIHDQYCDQTSKKTTITMNTGLDAVYKKIPLQFRSSNAASQETMDGFCRNMSERHDYKFGRDFNSSLVVRESLAAYNECVRQSNLGVEHKVNFLQTQVTIDISAKKGDWSLRGVRYQKEAATCNTTSSDKGNELINENSVNKLSSVALPIVCSRTGVTNPAGVVEYPALELTVSTTAGTIAISVPAAALMPSRWSEQIIDRIRLLESQVIEARNRKIKLECLPSGDTQTRIVMGNDADLIYDLPSNLAEQGYRIVSGACHVSGWANGDQVWNLGTGQYTESRARCWFKNHRAGLTLVTQATVCRAAYQ